MKSDVAPEEKILRQLKEAERLARLAPGEWRLWIGRSAEQLGVERADLEASVKEIIGRRDKAEREASAKAEREARRREQAAARQRREADKTKQREFKVLAELPEREAEARLEGLAKRLDQDPMALREEFALTEPPAPEIDALWTDPVEAAVLLTELVKQLQRFVVFRQDTDAVAVALWIMLTWIHVVATHSPALALTSPEPDCGKSTLLGVLGRLTPRPISGVEFTGPALYRMVDRGAPTLLIDEADDLFHRKPDLRHVVNAGWTRGTTITRIVHGAPREFDPFCPKAIALKGRQLPDATATRSIIVDLWPKRPYEAVEIFLHADAPEFRKLRRKLARWGADSASTLAEAVPVLPDGFNNRLAANWRLLLAIAERGGSAWAKRARQAAIKLSRQQHTEPSQGRRLLAALHEIFTNRNEIASADIVELLASDADAEWCEYHGRPITQRQLAALLREFGIQPVVLHPGKRSDLSRRGYRRGQLENAFARFLPADPNIRTLK